MKKLFVLLTLTLALTISACTTSSPEPKDTTTFSGTIANLEAADLTGESLTVKAFIFTPEEEAIAETSVAANGAFSFELPNVPESSLITGEIFLSDCPEVIYSNPNLKTTLMVLKLFKGNEPAYSDGSGGQIYYANGPLVGGQNEASYLFSDSDVTIQGPCDTGLGVLNMDMKLKQGWNWTIMGQFPNSERIGYFTATPDSGYKWLIPVCTIGCSLKD